MRLELSLETSDQVALSFLEPRPHLAAQLISTTGVEAKINGISGEHRCSIPAVRDRVQSFAKLFRGSQGWGSQHCTNTIQQYPLLYSVQPSNLRNTCGVPSETPVSAVSRCLPMGSRVRDCLGYADCGGCKGADVKQPSNNVILSTLSRYTCVDRKYLVRSDGQGIC